MTVISYSLGYSFSGYQATAPRNPLPAAQLDAELAGVSASVASIISALADVRRSDGALKNGVVTLEALSPEAVATLSAGAIDAWKPVAAWATGLVCVATAPATVVTYDGETWLCTEAHTAGATFSSAKFIKIAARGETGAGTGDLLAGNNLSDVASASTALANLGGATAADLAALTATVSALSAALALAQPKPGDLKEVAYEGTAETGWLDADGSAVSRTTYAALFAKLVTGAGYTAQTFTVTIAAPGVVTKTAHGFVGGERLRLSTTGALPAGLSTSVDYFVEKIDADTFYLLSAKRGSRVTTSGTQSGTHSYVRSTWGLGDGSTTFNLPDLRDEYVRGKSSTRPLGAVETNQNLAHTHTFTTSTDGAHTHDIWAADGNVDGTGDKRLNNLLDNSTGADDTGKTSSNGSHNHTGTTASSGGTEVRTNATFVRWLVKT